MRWCSARKVTLAEVEPFHVARYMRELGEPRVGGARKAGLAPLSRKQQRAALKRRCVLAALPSDICNHSFRASDLAYAERARAFNVLLDGRRIREDLGFKPQFPRLADALAAGA